MGARNASGTNLSFCLYDEWWILCRDSLIYSE
uniref:Uncharacterized protein n=1 Tax=Arundo donax TaxID=35708 RepID=A0A0A8YB72_ARUDO